MLSKNFTCTALTLAIGLATGLVSTKVIAKAATAQSSSGKSTFIPPSTFERLEAPITELKDRVTLLQENKDFAEKISPSLLEANANSAVLSRALRSVYELATKQRWQQTEKFGIFPIDKVAASQIARINGRVDIEGARVALFALRFGRIQRGVLLTSSFQPQYKTELADLFRTGNIVRNIDAARTDYDSFAVELFNRMRDDNNRVSRYLPANGNAQSWSLGCEATFAGRFCVNAKLFDSVDTNPNIFIEALIGINDSSPWVREIREQNLAWPIDRAYISRGFKSCRCSGVHYGLDLATPFNTPVRSLESGVIHSVGTYNGWGRAVVIEHDLPSGAKYVTLYGHLNRFRKGLKVGTPVRRGEIIALSGNSGTSFGPHLHLEVRKLIEGKEVLKQPTRVDEQPLDPLKVLNVFNILAEPT